MNVAARPIRGLSLCSGVGTLELGVRLAIGPRFRTVAYVERDPFAASVLVARMAESLLDPAPVWDDLTTFRGNGWRGKVDLVTGGFPCQPFSSAGEQRGLDDERWIWPDIARILGELRPQLAFFENVRPIIKRGLPIVLGDLADLGLDAEWSCLSAAAVGAPHKRERLWLLAYRHGYRLSIERGDLQPDGNAQRWHDADRPGGAALAHAQRVEGRERHDIEPIGRRSGNAQQARMGGRLPLWPPRPDDHDGWERARGEGNPEPSVRRVADGLAHRVDRLHAIGNGVVPLVAACAFVGLARRAGVMNE